MATKIECDRCGKQWDPTAERDKPSSRQQRLCVVRVDIPHGVGSGAAELVRSYDLCRECAHKVKAYLSPEPDAG